ARAAMTRPPHAGATTPGRCSTHRAIRCGWQPSTSRPRPARLRTASGTGARGSWIWRSTDLPGPRVAPARGPDGPSHGLTAPALCLAELADSAVEADRHRGEVVAADRDGL